MVNDLTTVFFPNYFVLYSSVVRRMTVCVRVHCTGRNTIVNNRVANKVLKINFVLFSDY